MRSRIFATALAAGLASAAASAADENGHFHIMGDPGTMTCGQLETLMSDVEAGRTLGLWIAGYVTALNRTQPDTYHILGGVQLSAFFQDLVSLCRIEPTALVEEAVFVAIERAKPTRQTKAP